jgi:Type II secretion system (T2SS), protein G
MVPVRMTDQYPSSAPVQKPTSVPVLNPALAGGQQSKSAAGWIFGGLSFIPLFGILFGVVAIVIGAVKKTRGQIYLGIAGIIFSVLLYGGVFYFGFFAKTGPYVELRIRLVHQQMQIDAGQIALYKGQHGSLPATLSDLGKPSEKNMFFTADPWGKQFKYTPLGDGHFELTSAGPDREFGTPDDVTEKF